MRARAVLAPWLLLLAGCASTLTWEEEARCVHWAWEDYLATADAEYPSGSEGITEAYRQHAVGVTGALARREYPDWPRIYGDLIPLIEDSLGALLSVTEVHPGDEERLAIREWAQMLESLDAPNAVAGCDLVDPTSVYRPPELP